MRCEGRRERKGRDGMVSCIRLCIHSGLLSGSLIAASPNNNLNTQSTTTTTRASWHENIHSVFTLARLHLAHSETLSVVVSHRSSLRRTAHAVKVRKHVPPHNDPDNLLYEYSSSTVVLYVSLYRLPTIRYPPRASLSTDPTERNTLYLLNSIVIPDTVIIPGTQNEVTWAPCLE